MATTKELKEENKNQYWHKDHIRWIADIKLWQQETHRLVALLYRLEKAIPEHSSKLQAHLALIEKHEQKITQYQRERDQRYLEVEPDFVSIERQHEFYKAWSKLHEETKQQHAELKQSYVTEMDSFRDLAKALLAEEVKF
jgi:hypothetical protein